MIPTDFTLTSNVQLQLFSNLIVEFLQLVQTKYHLIIREKGQTYAIHIHHKSQTHR